MCMIAFDLFFHKENLEKRELLLHTKTHKEINVVSEW